MAAKQFFPEVLLIDEGANFSPYGFPQKLDVIPQRDASQAKGRTVYLRADLAIRNAESAPAAEIRHPTPDSVPLAEHQAVIAQRDRAQAELETAKTALRQAQGALAAKTP